MSLLPMASGEPTLTTDGSALPLNDLTSGPTAAMTAAATIATGIPQPGVDGRGLFHRHRETADLDEDWERAAVLTIARELNENGQVPRYRVDPTHDAFLRDAGETDPCTGQLLDKFPQAART